MGCFKLPITIIAIFMNSKLNLLKNI